MGLISSAEAAERLGVHITRVQVLIREGRLPAQKIGRTYVVNEDDLKLVEERKPGRPPKPKEEKEAAKGSRKRGGRK
jgi:excisionase family DNA binding protein